MKLTLSKESQIGEVGNLEGSGVQSGVLQVSRTLVQFPGVDLLCCFALSARSTRKGKTLVS